MGILFAFFALIARVWARTIGEVQHWRLHRKFAACSHQMLGTECIECGWEWRMLHVHVPAGWTLDPAFIKHVHDLAYDLFVEVRWITEPDSTSVTWRTLGWDMSKDDYLEMTRACSFTVSEDVARRTMPELFREEVTR